MRWRTRWFLILAGLLLLMGCAAPAPRPTPPPSPPQTADATPIPAGATLTVTASGTIPAGSPYGCLASLLIDPRSGVVDRMATWDDARFAVDFQGTGPGCNVRGPAIGAPATLAPGRYRLAGVASLVSDVNSPGFSFMPIMGTTVRCDVDLSVLPTTTAIAIRIVFRDGPCTIKVTTR